MLKLVMGVTQRQSTRALALVIFKPALALAADKSLMTTQLLLLLHLLCVAPFMVVFIAGANAIRREHKLNEVGRHSTVPGLHAKVVLREPAYLPLRSQ